MSAEPYTPDRGTVRYRYVDGDYSGGNRDPHAEFDRFIAKIRADALREFAKEWGDGREGFPYFPLMERADRVEEEA